MKHIIKRIVPPRIWRLLVRVVVGWEDRFRNLLERFGYVIARKDDFYSPLPSVAELKRHSSRWHKPSSLTGLKLDGEKYKSTLVTLITKYLDEFSQQPEFAQVRAKGFGLGYTAIDSMVLYMMIREYKPKRYIEVGSGMSTYYSSLAGIQNQQEGYPLKIECIEPFPLAMLHTIPDITLYPNEVQDVDISLFEELQANDILFIDSSHIVRIDGDVPFLFLEVLPKLNKGVLIHIHDIAFPYNVPYPPEKWIYGQHWPKFWNEVMLLQAFLCFNPAFEIEMSTPYLRYTDESFLRQNIPIYESLQQNPDSFSSIWIRRVE